MIAAITVIAGGCSRVNVKEEAAPVIKAEPAPKVTEDRPFTPDTLYSLLAAEMAGDRLRFDVMLGNYVQQARDTMDPGVIARATRLARHLNAHSTALEMTLLWLEIDPQNHEAHYIAAAELIHHNQLIDAIEHAEFLLLQGETTGFDAIAARAAQGGDIETTQQLIERFESQLSTHSQHLPLHLGLSLLYQHAGNLDQALAFSQSALQIEANDFQAAAQETRVLQQMGRNDQALAKLGALVDRNPDNFRLRLQYARSLLKTDLATAQHQFEVLQEQSPSDQDIELTLALIEYERGLLSSAKDRFSGLLQNDQRQSTAHYYLGRIALVQKDSGLAMTHFAQVKPGPDFLPALSQWVELKAAQGESDEALKAIRTRRNQLPANQAAMGEGLYLLEANLYSNQGQLQKAVASLQSGIAAYPESVKLIYSRAMIFTKLDQFSQAEQDFQRVLSITPDHAATLNAWGYTLADRSERLEEAYRMISKAYQLTPDDPAVIDSMGWVEYRMGNLDKSISILREAMNKMPDHEIAAHLGEVLWVKGLHEEARQIWRQGLKQNPESPFIKQALIRLNATLP